MEISPQILTATWNEQGVSTGVGTFELCALVLKFLCLTLRSNEIWFLVYVCAVERSKWSNSENDLEIDKSRSIFMARKYNYFQRLGNPV